MMKSEDHEEEMVPTQKEEQTTMAQSEQNTYIKNVLLQLNQINQNNERSIRKESIDDTSSRDIQEY